MFDFKKIFRRALSYLLVAVLASVMTLFLFHRQGSGKLSQLSNIIQNQFIGQVDKTAMEDAAAEAMVNAIGDQWSYYMTAQEYADSQQQKKNTYVGIGITVSVREDETGFDILKVESDGPAAEVGVQAGDVLVEVDGQSVAAMDITAVGDMIRGPVGTEVSISVLRAEEKLAFTLDRRTIDMVVAEGKLLPGNIGLVTIENFNSKCAKESMAAVEALLEQGAEALIFDVRNNPGGYLSELVNLLDYLLPEGVLLKSMEYSGQEEVNRSDAECVELPMAVLVNADSYSAAEFFAAALQEYDWAVLVGQPTTGKGYYQRTQQLIDGSAVNLSVGKYFTPNGVSLTEVGGLKPDIEIPVDEETAAKIYAGMLTPEEDPQIQAAVTALTESVSTIGGVTAGE